MKAVKFPESNLVVAEDQPEYLPLPAFADTQKGIMTFCWELSWSERISLLLTGKLWHQVMTFNRPLQPQLLSVDKPKL